ncbi:MAG: nucleoside hydrolase [Tannerellaceae bacterium]|jgi:inosine-uridine nucleoside N-ribohydrolase|nr:nucleoside hydrolase [Tannerellaceae bacterium]
MKTILSLLIISLIAISCAERRAGTVNLILDTDLGPDFDDVGAMALMHAMADSGYVNILATVASNGNELVAPCISVINHYFNRPDIPIGAPKGNAADFGDWHKVKWTEALPARYPHSIAKTSDAEDAVKVYRKILAAQPDTSVTICTIGFLTNMRNLLESSPDEFSPLSGRELVAQKVKRLASMAGAFPAGREYNVFVDSTASVTVFADWPTEILLSGFEIGVKILTGTRIIASQIENSPIKDTYSICLAEQDFEGRMSWDQTAVLVAVKGYEPYFNTERGRMIVSENGSNGWEADPKGKHIRLVEKLSPQEMATIIETYMMHQPLKN